MTKSSISRRIESASKAYLSGDYEACLVHYFPALDKTAKKRYSNDGVGNRIRKFLHDQEEVIMATGFGTIIKGARICGASFEEAIYKYGRTSIAHEGELDPKLKIVTDNQISITEDWILPANYILGLILGVVCCEENLNETNTEPLTFTIMGKPLPLSQLWGKEAELRRQADSIPKRNTGLKKEASRTSR